jgi:hypothetical protein
VRKESNLHLIFVDRSLQTAFRHGGRQWWPLQSAVKGIGAPGKFFPCAVAIAHEIVVFRKESRFAQEEVHGNVNRSCWVTPQKNGEAVQKAHGGTQDFAKGQNSVPVAWVTMRIYGREIPGGAKCVDRCFRKVPLGEHHNPLTRHPAPGVVFLHSLQSLLRFEGQLICIRCVKFMVRMVAAMQAQGQLVGVSDEQVCSGLL